MPPSATQYLSEVSTLQRACKLVKAQVGNILRPSPSRERTENKKNTWYSGRGRMAEARKGGPGIGLGVGMNSVETKEKQDTTHTP